jgi:hypothetical protein
MELSTKTGENVNEVFSNLAITVISKLSSYSKLFFVTNKRSSISLGNYYAMGWPNYIPSTEALKRMVKQLNGENSSNSNTKSSCEIQ